MRSRIVAFAFLVCAAARPSFAAQFDVGHLPAASCWAIHVDFDAARRSAVAKDVLAVWLQLQGGKSKLDAIQRDLGFHPLTEVAGLTAYDRRFKENSGVVMVHLTSVKPEKLIGLLKARRPNHESTEHRSHTVYSWLMHEGSRREHRVSGSIHDKTVIFSRDSDLVCEALDRLDDMGTRLSAESPLAAEVQPGTIFLARAAGMAGRTTPFRWKVLGGAQRLSIAVGEDAAGVFVAAQLQAASAEVARNCKEAVEGFRAMAVLQDNTDETALRMLQGLTVEASGREVAAEWRIDADDLRQAITLFLKKQAAKPKISSPAANSPSNTETRSAPDVGRSTPRKPDAA